MHYVLRTAARLGLDLKVPGARVLDFGCGSGVCVQALLAEGVEIWGVDVSPDALRLARAAAPGEGMGYPRISETVKNRTCFPDAFFDFVHANQVLEHVADLPAVAKEIHRILKPGGVFYSTSPSKWTPIEPHIFVPFVHWLPAGRSRIRYITLFTKLGLKLPYGKSPTFQDNYLATSTFYLSRGEFTRALSHIGVVQYVANEQIRAMLVERFQINVPLVLSDLAGFLISLFYEYRVAIRKPG